MNLNTVSNFYDAGDDSAETILSCSCCSSRDLSESGGSCDHQVHGNVSWYKWNWHRRRPCRFQLMTLRKSNRNSLRLQSLNSAHHESDDEFNSFGKVNWVSATNRRKQSVARREKESRAYNRCIPSLENWMGTTGLGDVPIEDLVIPGIGDDTRILRSSLVLRHFWRNYRVKVKTYCVVFWSTILSNPQQCFVARCNS